MFVFKSGGKVKYLKYRVKTILQRGEYCFKIRPILGHDGATQLARSCGGGSNDTSLSWGRNEDKDDRQFAYRCMMRAHKMLKPSQLKRGLGIRLCNQRPFTSLSSQIFIGFAVSHHCFHVCLCPFCKLLYEREK